MLGQGGRVEAPSMTCQTGRGSRAGCCLLAGVLLLLQAFTVLHSLRLIQYCSCSTIMDGAIADAAAYLLDRLARFTIFPTRAFYGPVTDLRKCEACPIISGCSLASAVDLPAARPHSRCSSPEHSTACVERSQHPLTSATSPSAFPRMVSTTHAPCSTHFLT